MAPLLLLFAVAYQTPASAVEVPFRTIAFGKNGAIKDGGAIVMRNAADFDAYRKKMGTADQKRPVVDWSKEQVVAIHAAGAVYGPSSIQVVKVKQKANGSLEIEAALDRGTPRSTGGLGTTSNTLNVTPVLRQDGLYTLIVVPPSRGEVTLRVVDPPSSSGDRSGTPGSR